MKWVALFSVLLSACVTSAPAVHEDGDTRDAVSSWEEARADLSCVVPLCDEAGCAVWRCHELVEVDPHPVLLALAHGTLRPPPNPTRWWARPLAAPGGTEPVFEIPWHNWRTRELSQRRLYLNQCLIPREPFEKHHIFPQQPELARWFKIKGIDIHAFTIRLPRSFHQWLHSGGPEGGQWNEAWRQFMNKNRNIAQGGGHLAVRG